MNKWNSASSLLLFKSSDQPSINENESTTSYHLEHKHTMDDNQLVSIFNITQQTAIKYSDRTNTGDDADDQDDDNDTINKDAAFSSNENSMQKLLNKLFNISDLTTEGSSQMSDKIIDITTTINGNISTTMVPPSIPSTTPEFSLGHQTISLISIKHNSSRFDKAIKQTKSIEELSSKILSQPHLRNYFSSTTLATTIANSFAFLPTTLNKQNDSTTINIIATNVQPDLLGKTNFMSNSSNNLPSEEQEIDWSSDLYQLKIFSLGKMQLLSYH